MEINSHGLFSKWFSESGKLVVKMFQKIQELIDDPEALICILMDEVCVNTYWCLDCLPSYPLLNSSKYYYLLHTLYYRSMYQKILVTLCLCKCQRKEVQKLFVVC